MRLFFFFFLDCRLLLNLDGWVFTFIQTSYYGFKRKKGDIKSIVSNKSLMRMHSCSEGEIPIGYQNLASLIRSRISSFRVYRYFSLLFKHTCLNLRCQTDGLWARAGSTVGPIRPTGPTPNIDNFCISYSQIIKDTFRFLIISGLLYYFVGPAHLKI